MISLIIYVSYALGPMCLSDHNLDYTLGRAERRLKQELGIAVQFIRDEEVAAITSDIPLASMALYDLWTAYNRLVRGVRPRLVTAGLLQERYTAGVSQVCRPTDGLSIAFVAAQNQAGDSRREHAVYTIMHELGHLLGAQHDNRAVCSIMGANMLPCVRPKRRLKFSSKSKKEIKKCLTK